MKTKKCSPKYPEFLGVKVSVELRRAIERAAAAEDRSVAAFIRRAIQAALPRAK